MPCKRAKRGGQAHAASAETSLSAAAAPPSATDKSGHTVSSESQLFDVNSYPLDNSSAYQDDTHLSPSHSTVASSSQASRFLLSPMRRARHTPTSKGTLSRERRTQKSNSARDGAADRTDVPVTAEDSAASGPVEAGALTSDAGAEETTMTQGLSLGARTLQALLRGDPVEAVVSTVVEQCGTNNNTTAALCGALNLLVKAAGVVDVELDAEALRDGADIASLLEELYARLPIGGSTGSVTVAAQPYLLAANKDPRCRRFQRGLISFFEVLLRRAFAADVLLPGAVDTRGAATTSTAVLPVLAQWVGMMSESKTRAFRHTATVALLGILRALNVLVTEQQERLALTRTRKDTGALQRRIDELAEWRNHLFSQSIHQRLRDVAAEIRLAVFAEMKLWVIRFPGEYMENRYLRYFGMALHDKRPELRVEALDMILQALAHVTEAYHRMHLFLQYFIHRLVEMSHDVDIRCAELAIRVVALIVRGDAAGGAGGESEDAELISNEMIDRVLLSSLFDERGAIRGAAGIVLKVFLHCRTLAEADEPRRVALATELLCTFAKTLRAEYREEMPERYLVDALWSPEQPPAMLLEYGPLLAAARSDVAEEAIVGLHLVAALLQRARDMTLLGPASKEDRRGGGGGGSSKRVNASAREATEKLVTGLSKDAGAALSTVLQKHHTDNAAVLPAVAAVVAALDLGVFTGEHMTLQLSALLVELRRACGELTALRQSERDALQSAWHTLAFTAHPLRNEAQAHLQELLRIVLPQWRAVLKREVGEATPHTARQELAVWTKVHLLSGLVALQAEWAPLISFLDTQCAIQSSLSTTSPDIMSTSVMVLQLAIGTAVNCVLWTLRDGPGQADSNTATEGRRENATSLQARIEQLVNILLRLLPRSLEAEQSLPDNADADDFATEQRTQWREFGVEALTALCDMAALPDYATMPQLAQEQVTALAATLLRHLSRELRAVQEVVRTAAPVASPMSGTQGDDDVAMADDGTTITTTEEGRQPLGAKYAHARQASAHVEAAQLRLVVAVARLFLLGRLAPLLVPRLLCEWTQTPSKAVSDAFKALFHALREQEGAGEGQGGFGLERDTIVQAYNECAQLGATPASVEAFYQVGLKLASLHFAAVDRYYDACPRIVRFAVSFAANTDPLILQAVVPYCSKLRIGDALHILQHDLGSHELFVQASNPFARSFITALRRAAKLETGPAMTAATVDDTAAVGHKRPRELIHNAAADEEAQMLAEMERQVMDKDEEEEGQRTGIIPSAGLSPASRPATKRTPRQHDMDSSQATPIPSQTPDLQPRYVQGAVTGMKDRGGRTGGRHGGRAARSIVNVPSTQETAQSTGAFGDEADQEVFIGTEEFD